MKDREYLRVRVIWNEEPGFLIPTIAVSTLEEQNFVYLAREKSESEANNNENDAKADNSSSQTSGEQSSASCICFGDRN